MLVFELEREQEREYAREKLRTHYLVEGQSVYVLARSTPSSNISHDINLFTVNEGKIEEITYYSALALGWSLVEKNGAHILRVKGFGESSGLYVVQNLSVALFGLSQPQALRYERL
jgi:hypothetical protein